MGGRPIDARWRRERVGLACLRHDKTHYHCGGSANNGEYADDGGRDRKVIGRRREPPQNIASKAGDVAGGETQMAGCGVRGQGRHDKRGKHQKNADQLNQGDNRDGNSA